MDTDYFLVFSIAIIAKHKVHSAFCAIPHSPFLLRSMVSKARQKTDNFVPDLNEKRYSSASLV
ncbi:MAG: hypothetical protein F6K31_16510 [Symploca sp. SIO2G7]|nr:hypothetical protein [Symploca sp. SIO2G7]